MYDLRVPSQALVQTTIALSSGEAELSGIGSGMAQGLGIQSLCADMLWPLKVRVHSDATAAIGISKRRGVGKIRHLEAKDLWIQDKVEKKELMLGRVPTADNMSDIGTKYVPAVTLDRHLKALHLTVEERTGGATDPEGDEPHG